MNNAQIGDKILSYDNEQTTQINDNKNQIEAVEQSVTALDTKLSKDYIVDYGSNSNGSWEKWNSGKLVQTNVVTVARTATSKFVDYTWTFPIPFFDDKSIIYAGVFECIQQGVSHRYGKLLTSFSSNIAEKIFRGKDEDSNLFNDYKFRLRAEGTWK